MRDWSSFCLLLRNVYELQHVLSFSVLQNSKVLNVLLNSQAYYNTNNKQIRTFHSSSIFNKQKKARNVINLKPKSQSPTVPLWSGANALDIAKATNRHLDDVFKAISYLENGEHYKDPTIEIRDNGAILAIVKYLGYRVQMVSRPENEVQSKANINDLCKRPPADAKDLVKKPPVVAIMGHVDHGKTTLLDSLRHSSIVSQEFGGITQHIGAFTVKLPQGQITFLDTPGHAAFYTMRARGAHATDLVVLVVAADDGIMEQTVESVRFAREANVPIIVAINKIDKASINVDNVKQRLMNIGLQIEDFGGEVQAIPISALKNINLDLLTEAILTQAEMMNVSADPKGPVEGLVLESSLDTVKGKVSTALIQRGTLKKGDIIVAGTSYAKVRAMYDEHWKELKEVTPGMPVQVIGWKSFPLAGEIILLADSEKHARAVIKYREEKQMEVKMLSDQPIIEEKAQQHLEKYREERHARLMRGRYRKERNYFREKESVEDLTPHLSFVLKGDVHGSVEAILDVVDTYPFHKDCRVDVIHSGVGPVSQTDIELAETFGGFIYTFNVQVSKEMQTLAAEKSVAIKPYNVIYHLIDDMKRDISSKLPLVEEEEILGEAIVLQEFFAKEKKNKIPVAGCKCLKGVLKKSHLCKVIRSERVLYNGPIASLRHEKTNVESIKQDVECGLMITDQELSFEPGDTIICYSTKHVPQITTWDPGF